MLLWARGLLGKPQALSGLLKCPPNEPGLSCLSLRVSTHRIPTLLRELLSSPALCSALTGPTLSLSGFEFRLRLRKLCYICAGSRARHTGSSVLACSPPGRAVLALLSSVPLQISVSVGLDRPVVWAPVSAVSIGPLQL